MKSLLARLILLSLTTLSTLQGEQTRVEWFNSPGTELKDLLSNPLKAGTIADFDGSLLQLGYYTLATHSDPFAGLWVPLTGLGSNNDGLSSIGDKGNQSAGRFNISSVFTLGSPSSGNDLPLSSLPLSIRFYDSFSEGSSAYYNAVSDTSGTWDWLTPSNPQAVVTVSLLSPSIIWEGGAGSAYRTTLNIPEPASAALLLAGAFLMALPRTLRRHERNG
jgi:hypothetical protein